MPHDHRPLGRPNRPRSLEIPGAAWLAAVITGHALALGGVALGGAKASEPIAPPAVKVVLIAPQPPVAAPRPPRPAANRPKPKPRPKAEPRSTAPVLPPSERAVTLPDPPKAAPVETEIHPGELTDGLHASSAGEAEASDASPAPESPIGEPLIAPHADAVHLDNPVPEYPRLSRRLHEEGRVLLDVYILADGSVGEIALRTSSGFARLDAAALEAVRRWRYVPARQGTEAVATWYIQPITFSLDR